MPWVNWDTVLASLRVMGWGMAGIMITALAFWGAIVVLRRVFPPRGAAEAASEGGGQQADGPFVHAQGQG